MVYKRIISVIILTLFIAACSVNGAIANETKAPPNFLFNDVPQDFWAKDAINVMVDKGILDGYSDGSFRPNQQITRAEFARLMVLSLALPLKTVTHASFKDVKPDNWAYPSVETAKYYLTGFRYADGDYFEPGSPAVREDMAVALVKALGYSSSSDTSSSLEGYSDKDKVSPNLLSYVESAVKNNIMQGYDNNGLKEFKPQSPLTRAEASMLLYKAIQLGGNAAKVTYDDNDAKYVEENSELIPYPVPVVSIEVDESHLCLKWNPITDRRLQGYKVVASKGNQTPQYPNDGYLYWITERNKTSAIIDNSSAYNGGDFGKYLAAGQRYYFSVTAVYNDRMVPGNAVSAVYPGRTAAPSSYTVPRVTGVVKEDHILLHWQALESSKLQGYKVVISKSNSNPAYPNDGYLYWITDLNQTYASVDNSSSYNGGDIDGYLVSGENYYFSITAVYSDKKVPGNTIRLRFP